MWEPFNAGWWCQRWASVSVVTTVSLRWAEKPMVSCGRRYDRCTQRSEEQAVAVIRP